MDEPGASFGALLRAYRAAANLTQEELAERSGLSVQAVSALERGVRRAPRASSVGFLAEALKLDAGRRQTLVAAARGLVPPSDDERVTPAQLPRALSDFTGRAGELALLRGLLEREGDAGPTVVAVTGAPGAGKSALVVQVAHRARPCFPDGQLFVDLKGAEGAAIPPADVLAGFLRGLGLDGSAIPAGAEDRMGLYRARTADRRILVVLDNAAGEAQVRPLLPSGPGAAALVASRGPLSGLEAAHQLPLDVLPPVEAAELLARVAGRARVAAEPDAAREIVQVCGRLPLAVRIAGARLAARPSWALRGYAARLAAECQRLDELRAGDLEVRASLALSYRALDPEARRALRLLGALEAADFPAWQAAGLLDREHRSTEALLERLMDAHLLESPGEDVAGQVRYRLQSLLRLFARELLAEDGAAACRAALERALGAQLALAERAQRVLSPGGAA